MIVGGIGNLPVKQNDHLPVKQNGPSCPYLNLSFGGKQATVLLENPKGEFQLTYGDLLKQVCCINIHTLNMFIE